MQPTTTHQRLIMDLQTPEQMAILHETVQQKAQDEGFNALATKLSDYYQMETTYVRSERDIVTWYQRNGCTNNLQISSFSNSNPNSSKSP